MYNIYSLTLMNFNYIKISIILKFFVFLGFIFLQVKRYFLSFIALLVLFMFYVNFYLVLDLNFFNYE